MNRDGDVHGERKRVTVLFADILDSTRFVERRDPEEAISALTPIVEAMIGAVTRFEGTVVKVMGDGIMAIFGAPVALEHHAAHACRAALDMQRLVEARRQATGDPDSAGLRIHVGIATGEVVAGVLGEDSRGGYDAAGFTVHLASRLQSLAPGGATYISRRTYESVRDEFGCKALGPTRIRGSTEPVEVYALTGLRRESDAGADGPRDGHPVPLVGRGAELEILAAITERLLQGRGGIVSIVGDPGVGKSRLVGEFRRRVAGLPLQWLEGAALSYGRTLSYWPFLEILRGFAEIGDDDDETTAWGKLERKISMLFETDAADVLPYVATLMGLRVRGSLEERVKYLDGDAIRRQVLRSMRLLFERMAVTRPTLLVVEDAFWMDLSSAALLMHLQALVESAPLLFCLVTRGERDGPDSPLRAAAQRDYPDRYQEIVLKPLTSDDANRLLDSLLPAPALPGTIRKTILAATEGNPLFLEEVVQAMIAGGTIVRDRGSGEWRAAGSMHFEVPGSIQSVIMARVDRLEEHVKETLKTASVVGRTFFVRVLAVMMGSELDIQRDLAVLRSTELILDRRREPEPECMFKHVLVQEATYDSILLRRRRELHARAGAAIEQVFADRLDDLFGLLAYHYARAEQWDKAHHYLLKAGDQAEKLAADEEALSHFQSASEAYLRAFGREATPLWQATIVRKIGEALYRKGDSSGAQQRFREALGLLGTSDPRTDHGLYFQILRQVLVQACHRLLPTRHFDRRLGGASPVDDERVRLYTMLWWLHFFSSPQRTLFYSLKMLNESERSGALAGIVHSCATIGFACDVLGAPPLALRYHRRAAECSRDSANPVVIGQATLGLGWHGSYTGNWRDALAHFRESTAASRSAGDLNLWGSATWGIVQVLCYQGRFADAWSDAQELFEISEASGDKVNLRWSRLAQGMVLQRVGAFAAAEERLVPACQEGQAAADWQIYTRSLCELAESSLQQGNVEAAAAAVQQAESTVQRHRLMGHHVTELRNAAAALLLERVERHEGAARPVVSLARRAKRACRRAVRAGQVMRGALPRALRLSGRLAWLTGDRAAAELWWQRSLAVAEELGAGYDLALTNLEIGRRLHSAAHHQRGEALLAETRKGLPPDLRC